MQDFFLLETSISTFIRETATIANVEGIDEN